jgi:N-acetylglucosamine-6-phosphate deacetylase
MHSLPRYGLCQRSPPGIGSVSQATTLIGRDPRTSRPLQVRVSDGIIVGVEESSSDPEEWIAPGLIDLQVNGFAGYDFNSDDPDPDRVIGAARRLMTEGVATFVPTLVTASHEQVSARLTAIAAARRQDPAAGQMIPYAHLEGPHISDQDGPRGVHDLEWIRSPSLDEFADWQAVSGGLVGMVTVSPHYRDSSEYIAALSDMSVHVAIGHTHANDEQIHRAVQAGARLSTHLGNGAHTMLPRHPNYLWTQLAEDRLTAGFIADGHHLPAATLKSMVRAKGPARAVLVSDAVTLACCAPGRYRTPVGGTVELSRAGRLSHVGSGLLAGAAKSLAHGVAFTADNAGLGLATALELATVNPGRFVGGRGTLAVGQRADIILFRRDPADGHMDVTMTMLGGARNEAAPS